MNCRRKMNNLNPCEDGMILSLLDKYCPLPGALLDAGCGLGGRLGMLSAEMPGTRLCGVELDVENAGIAGAVCPEAEIVAGDICALPYTDGEFDAVLCECVLSLTNDPPAALAEIRRVLSPGGILLLGDLCTQGSTPPEKIGRGKGLLFSFGWMDSALIRAGFRILELRDCQEELLGMAARMILDGSFGGCTDKETAMILKRHRAGYGLWTVKKEAEL